MNTPHITKHPLRTMRLAYDPSKEKQAIEEAAIAAYVAVHDEFHRRKTELSRQGDLQEEMQYLLTGLQGRLLSLEQELEFHEVGLGLASPEILPPLTTPISLDPVDLFNATRVFQEDFQKLYEGMVRCYEGHDAFIKDDEAFDEQFERFDRGICRELYDAYEQISLDVVAFDRDYDNMRGLFTPYRVTKEMFYARSEAFFDAYAGFVRNVNAFFRRVEQVDEGTDKLLKKLRDQGRKP